MTYLQLNVWMNMFTTSIAVIPQEPLADIEYRNSSRELDILCHVFRWDVTPYQQVFENGFNARHQEGTSDEIFFNLDYYVHHGGRPLDSTRATTHAFVSTTISSGWHPTLPDPGTERQVYRYEIYAPGGILVRDTLGDRYKYFSQDEVCFVAGIAPQYIRSAQLFRLVHELNSRHTKRVREDNILILNGYFNPQSHSNRLLCIQRPVCYYFGDKNERMPLEPFTYKGESSIQEGKQHDGARWQQPPKVYKRQAKVKRFIFTSQDTSQGGKQHDGARWQQPPKVYKRRAKVKHFIFTSQDTSQEGKQHDGARWQQPAKVYKRQAKVGPKAYALV